MVKKKARKDVTLNLDVSLEALTACRMILDGKGTTVEEWISLQIRALARTGGKNILGLQDKIQAGKYAGELIDTVCRVATSYMTWTLNNYGKRYHPEVFKLVECLNGDLATHDEQLQL